MDVQRLDSISGSARAAYAKAAVRAAWIRLRWRRRPPWPGFGEPLNGQAVRRRTFEHLVARFSPTAFIETGTFLGATTAYLANLGRDTYSVEVNPSFQLLSRFSLRGRSNVTLVWGDSVAGVRWLGERGIERPLAYLDAHWEERVPLAEELESLFQLWPDVLIVIDDFFVPGEPGYGYDIYAGVPLAADGLDLPADAVLAYPSASPREESGARRGTAFVARGTAATAALESAAREGMVWIAAGDRDSGLLATGEEAVDLK